MQGREREQSGEVKFSGGRGSSVPQRKTVGQGRERESSAWPDLVNLAFAIALESEGRTLFYRQNGSLCLSEPLSTYFILPCLGRRREKEAERQTEITGGGWKGSRESVPRLSPHPPSTLPYLFHPLVFFC